MVHPAYIPSEEQLAEQDPVHNTPETQDNTFIQRSPEDGVYIEASIISRETVTDTVESRVYYRDFAHMFIKDSDLLELLTDIPEINFKMYDRQESEAFELLPNEALELTISYSDDISASQQERFRGGQSVRVTLPPDSAASFDTFIEAVRKRLNHNI